MARITSVCHICDAPLPVDGIIDHAQAHRGTVRVIVAGKARAPRRAPRRTARGRNRLRYLPVAGGGLGGLAGFLLFGTFLIALLCGALAFLGLRRIARAT